MNLRTILTTISGALVLGTALAAAPGAQSVINSRASLGMENGLRMKGEAISGCRMVKPDSRVKAPAKAPAEVITDVIYTAEGDLKLYSKNCGGFYLYYGKELGLYDAEDMSAEIVFGENNEVFFKNILSTASGANSYVKGTLEDNRITVELPQTVMWIENDPDYGNYGVNVDIMDYYIDPQDGQLYYFHDAEKKSICFDVAEDGTITMESLGDDMMLGYSYTDDGSFCGYGDTYQIYTPSEGALNTVPANVKLSAYTIVSGGYGYLARVGIDGDKVYFKGLSKSMPEGVVIGTLKDGKVTISQGQNVGLYSAYLLKTYVGVENPAYDPYDTESGEPEFLTREGDFVLDYDAENNRFTCVDEYRFLLFGVELTEDYIYYAFAHSNFSLAPHTTYAGTPMTPYDLKYYFLMDWGGYDAITFNLPNVSEEGDLLRTDYLYYTIFVNDIPYKFKKTGEAYDGIPEGETWTELPYSLKNEHDIYYWSDLEREIDFYFNGFDTVGIQSVYRYNDEEKYSKKLTLDVNTGEITLTDGSGVATIAAEDVKSVEYFDLNGCRVSNPEKGIFVKRTLSKTGKAAVEKVIK